jgi:hypothetical protein
MYDGYLALGGSEILNRARAGAYIERFLAGKVEVVCDDATLAAALGHSGYTTPAIDGAPWYKAGRVASSRFLGIFPGKIEGAEASTRTVNVTELSGPGAILTSPRYGSKEMRYVGTALALDEEAMEEGMAWLREVLSNDGCSDQDLGCTGREAKMFAALPKDSVAAYGLTRNFFRVEATEGPLPTKKFPVKGFVMWQIEFTLTAGIAWAFTSPYDVGALAMDVDSWNHQDPAGENCSAALDAYDDFIDDPYFTAISRPPRPPVILPPNILDINSWRRRTIQIPTSQSQRWGRVAPVVRVATTNAVQFLRLRFYREGYSGCDYDGEFLVSYVPANSVLTLDSVRREATVTLPGGRAVPAGNLLFGSDGTPFLWPTLGCQHTYTMTADLMPGQTGTVVLLETSVRE